MLAAIRTLVRRTDVARWTRNASQVPDWDDRNIQIANFIQDNRSVLDLGAGAQTLRSHLKRGCRYQPCDLVKSSPDVILCDFNRGIFPDISPQSFDYVVCSGVLEYIWDPEGFIARIRNYGSRLIVTYRVHQPGDSIARRLATGWVNHMTGDQINKLFTMFGLSTEVIATRAPAEYIFQVHSAYPTD